MKQVLAHVLAVTLVGCAHTQPPVTVPPQPPADCIECSIAIVLDDDMGAGYRLERIEAHLDGDPLYARIDPGDHLHELKSIELARELKISSGHHLKGGPTTPLEDRPAVRYEVLVE